MDGHGSHHDKGVESHSIHGGLSEGATGYKTIRDEVYSIIKDTNDREGFNTHNRDNDDDIGLHAFDDREQNWGEDGEGEYDDDEDDGL